MEPSYDLRPCFLWQVRKLCEVYHGYKSTGNVAVYSFGVFEDDKIVAGFLWQPPAPGAAKSVSKHEPAIVLALSRMVAIPKVERKLNHISKPLRRQMKVLIDRERWPILITYSDSSLGHTGHVYKCSGWQKTRKSYNTIYEDNEGNRRSKYNAGETSDLFLNKVGVAEIQRWEHWICQKDETKTWLEEHNFRRVPIAGKVWKSGNQAFTIVRKKEDAPRSN